MRGRTPTSAAPRAAGRKEARPPPVVWAPVPSQGSGGRPPSQPGIQGPWTSGAVGGGRASRSGGLKPSTARPWPGSTGGSPSFCGKTATGQPLPPGPVISSQLEIQVIKRMDKICRMSPRSPRTVVFHKYHVSLGPKHHSRAGSPPLPRRRKVPDVSHALRPRSGRCSRPPLTARKWTER